MIRLFVAIELPEDARDRLAMLCDGVDGAKWVSPDTMHLTLRFIGEVEEPVAEEIDHMLGRVRARPFRMVLDGTGHFGSRRKARALWVGVRKNAQLKELQVKIEAALRRAGLGPAGRKFSPHVTLARFSNMPAEALKDFLVATGRFRHGPIRVKSFTLFSSFLTRDGAIHRAEAEYPLAK